MNRCWIRSRVNDPRDRIFVFEKKIFSTSKIFSVFALFVQQHLFILWYQFGYISYSLGIIQIVSRLILAYVFQIKVAYLTKCLSKTFVYDKLRWPEAMSQCTLFARINTSISNICRSNIWISVEQTLLDLSNSGFPTVCVSTVSSLLWTAWNVR